MKKTEHPRDEMTLYIACHAPEELFEEDWADLSWDAQYWYETHDTLPCEGSGCVSCVCERCYFAVIEQE